MCGIFALLNADEYKYPFSFIKNQFEQGKHRGPEHSTIDKISVEAIFGFHRLAINGLNNISNQPIKVNNIVLICNGEIYNYKELYKYMGVIPTTDSDCEVIIHLYLQYGMEQTLKMLDGVFAFVLCDNQLLETIQNKIYVARDPYGVRPLYKLIQSFEHENSKMIGFASEIKMLTKFNDYAIDHFEPGTYSQYNIGGGVMSKWIHVQTTKYHEPIHTSTHLNFNMNWSILGIQHYLCNAVEKRYLNTERPIACLLSGGLDSSLITALVNEQHKKHSINPLETYSIGLKDSEDLKYARIVADYLHTSHTEIVVTEEEMCEIIPEIIREIESFDTTTVRASIGNYLLGKYISKNSDAKVIFNGDGSDELCGGYLYMGSCPDAIEYDKETRRLLKDIHKFDVLRSDKCISSHGLEPRTPFLDKSFVNFYLSIPAFERFYLHKTKCEKFLLRHAFSNDFFKNSNGIDLLPNEILWRKKEAFSDGVSGVNRSLYQIIQDFIGVKMNSQSNISTEKLYYQTLFKLQYSNALSVIPYLWMPKYIKSVDPSARTLDIYSLQT
jgi:asparagine synthase (glutamine-hydrolysing)